MIWCDWHIRETGRSSEITKRQPSSIRNPSDSHNKQWEDCVFNPFFVYYCAWLIVMLWALIYRWAGSSAEKDIHKMDQLPLGKGKKVWLCFPASASIVLSIYTKAGAGVCFKTPRSPCFSTVSDFTTSCVHALTFSKSWSWDCLFQLRPHTVLHSCMIFLLLVILSVSYSY